MARSRPSSDSAAAGRIAGRLAGAAAEPVLDVFEADGAYAGTLRGTRMPVGMLPTGELLVPEPDEETGGTVVAIYRVETGS